MLIHELAAQTGFSKDTIRFYEKQHLLPPPERARRAYAFRHYGQAHIDRLRLIRQAKRLGFSLEQIRTWITDWENNRLSQAEKEALFEAQLARIESEMAELASVRDYLRQKLTWVREGHQPAASAAG